MRSFHRSRDLRIDIHSLFVVSISLLLTKAGWSKLTEPSPAELTICGKSAKEWTVLLDHTDSRTQQCACQAIALLGPAADIAVPKLIELATDTDESLSLAAIEALGEIGPKSIPAIPLMLVRLSKEKQRVSIGKIESAIASVGSDAVPHLLKALDAGTAAQRMRCIETLGRIGGAAGNAVPSLARLLDSLPPEDPLLRETVTCLARIGESAKLASPPLLKLLKTQFAAGDPQDIGEPVTEALTSIGEPPFSFLMANMAADGGNRTLEAVRLLAKLGTKGQAAIPQLTSILKDTKLSEDLRIEVAVTLAKIDPLNDLVISTLIRVGPDNRDRAIEALRELGPRAMPALPVLLKWADDPSVDVQAQALSTLCHIDINGFYVQETLIRALTARNPEIKSASAYALGRIGPAARESVPGLAMEFGNQKARDVEDELLDTDRVIADALSRIHSKPEIAIPKLLQVLNTTNNARLRYHALIGLGGYQRSAIAGLPTLTRLLDGDYRGDAAQVIGNCGADAWSALPALQSAFKSNRQDAKDDLALAIWKIGGMQPSQIDLYLHEMENPYARAFFLGEVGRSCTEGRGIARILIRSLDDFSHTRRDFRIDLPDPLEYTILRLGKLGPSASAAVPRLTQFLRHSNPFIARAATEALGRIEKTNSRW